jgi:hypothetical protein
MGGIITAFQWAFDPSVEQSGAPIVVPRSDQARGRLDFFLQSNQDHGSAAHLLTSGGADIMAPATLRGANQLIVTPTFNYSAFFYAGGVFRSALTGAYLELYVEEFDTAGNFVRGIDIGHFDIGHWDGWWLSGSRTWGAGGNSWVIPQNGIVTVTQGFLYRVWLDLHGDIRADGWGLFGGSGAISQAQVRFVQFDWSIDPA